MEVSDKQGEKQMGDMRTEMAKAMQTTPNFQNIPSPKTKDGQAAAKFFKGSLNNYLIQANDAEDWLKRQWQQHLDEGYVEVAPGILRHPKTGTVVER